MGILAGLGADSYDRTYDDGALLRRGLTYFVPHRRRVAAIMVLVLVFAAIGALIPVVTSVGVDALRTNDSSMLLVVVVALGIIAVGDYFIYQLRRRFVTRLVADLIGKLREDAFNAAIERDLSFYDENKTGKVVSRITSDTQDLSQVIVLTTDIIAQVTEFLLVFVALLSREWRLTLMVLASMPVVIGAALAFRHLARVATRRGARSLAVVNDNIQESVSGITVAKNFRQEAMIYDEFRQVNRQSYNVNIRRGFVFATIFPTMNALSGFVVALVVYAGGQYAIDGVIAAGAWFLFVQGIDRFWFPVINISSFWSQLQLGMSALERIFALVDAENTVKQTGSVKPPAWIEGEIRFENVTFSYNTGGHVLDDFSLRIAPGESVAFVGHTGAGKSSIIKLITRFYEFQQGRILVDGQDIRTFDMEAYRSRLGIVPQQPFLFSGSVMDNIRYARPDATDAQVLKIANSIGGGEWIETLPEGLNTDVGERGARLSMGQRQLVALLRVLVQRPAIFILDEATASIDPFTETQIQDAIDLILKQSTSILVAHRLSTVRSADRIIVLRQGGIIEEGSHDALMTQGGHYAELYNTYFRHQSLSYIENARDMFHASTTR
ncbi:MAG: ABC transporter ATP-binding protein [Chloroflexi bacterium]|nr:ABC transporter ATP-binding protein [Chloroflexota bacterium]